MRGDFGKYRIVGEFGGHAAGRLLVAKEGRRSFLLVLPNSPARPGDAVHTALMDEARRLAPKRRLNGPEIVEEVTVKGQPFFAFELTEGRTLFLLRAAGLPRELGYLVLVEALAALQCEHELREARRPPLFDDTLSPHLTFVDVEGTVLLVSREIARALGGPYDVDQGESLRYISPERVNGSGRTIQSDVYAVGVMLWETATGQRIWSGRSDREVTRALCQGTLPPMPHRVRRSVPLRLDAICERALALDPSDRYPTAEAFKDDLEDFLDTSALTSRKTALGLAVKQLVDAEVDLGRGSSAERSWHSSELSVLLGEDDEVPTRLGARVDDEPDGDPPTSVSATLVDDSGDDAMTQVHVSASEPPASELVEEVRDVDIARLPSVLPSIAALHDDDDHTVDAELLLGASGARVREPSGSREQAGPQRGVLLLAGATAAVALGAVIAWQAMPSRAPVVPRQTSPVLVDERPPEEGEAPPEGSGGAWAAPPTAEDAGTILVRLSASPTSTRFSIDEGPLLGNPSELMLAPESGVHVILGVAEGYAPMYRKVRFARNIAVHLQLEKLDPRAPQPTFHAPGTMAPPSAVSQPAIVVPSVRRLDRGNPWR